jgi:hypothetical protein
VKNRKRPLLSKEDALAFRERWRLVNAREIEEMRSASMELKLQQFNTLLAWARELGWNEELRKGEAEVRERWMRLRKAYRGKKV